MMLPQKPQLFVQFLSRNFMEEQKHIGQYAQFIKDHPDMKAGKKRKKAYLKTQKVKKGTHIWIFFMAD